MKFKKVYAVLRFAPIYIPYFDIKVYDPYVEYFDKVEDALKYAELIKEKGRIVLIFEAILPKEESH